MFEFNEKLYYNVSIMIKKISRSKKEKLKIIIGIVLIVVVLIGITIYAVLSSRNSPVETVIKKEPIIVTPQPTEKPIVPEDAIEVVEEEKVVLENLLPYYEKNEDMVGWIKLDNTFVDYPVVYSGDNEYYLTNNFDRQESKEGAIFLDFRCDIEDFSKTRNVILYGHRMKDDSMFKTLTNYRKERFFKENPTFRFDTIYEKNEWEIFSVYKTKIDFIYIKTDFASNEDWLEFIEKCQDLSYHENDIKLYSTDIVLTLSTCTERENERFVVMARLKG